ncbi:hypothetical protein HFO32_21135 [Rhizobium leguminosarum]|uniref:hypothetical protein n=1 Tax=Rhizobium leguminosarum TaxID=384 RepID=UPI001C98768E|nr:hypothetical protein [Rhizobium leguminosarum]MBY5610431.1 hypothetical protein [Rhizobium leguminosarum]MBY5655323.1 hypothetical protein [Rhizobium leguminosarum]MBY5670117.1 hypothetical protein [Rhizobium leguminosarum]MBY5684628.1 hypothetical protein [Rhizobium leguminosarum]
MTKAEIISKAKSHYSNSSEPLLLSDFGKLLRNEKLWPVEGKKKLAEYLEEMKPDIDVVRDGSAPSYAVVVLEDNRDIAEQAIKIRQDRSFLRSLPKSVLIAFVANEVPGARIYLQTKPPFRYQHSTLPPSDDYIEVPSGKRISGLHADEVLEWRVEAVRDLAAKVRTWLEDNGVVIEFVSRARPDTYITPEPTARKVIPTAGISMLERLYSAQPLGVAEKMVIPVDIALLLSKTY